MIVPVGKPDVVTMECQYFLPGDRVEEHVMAPRELEVFVASGPPLANPEADDA